MDNSKVWSKNIQDAIKRISYLLFKKIHFNGTGLS